MSVERVAVLGPDVAEPQRPCPTTTHIIIA